LVEKFAMANLAEQEKIFNFYIKNAKQANNWDLVDLSAPKIVGEYLLDKSKAILYKFARSKNLWEKRIAILSTFSFIKRGKFKDSFKIAEILMKDEHDLIHKAVGWMLREIGKGNLAEEEKFLKKYSKVMPRTMLRYAIEKFPEEKRIAYLKGKI
jgi:3-methyladenine DNA glycosylase AlkD